MDIKVLKDDKEVLEIEIGNLTIAEILREYLHKDPNVNFAAWRQEHPSKPAILRVESKGKSPKKALQDAVSLITKEADKLVSDIKKV